MARARLLKPGFFTNEELLDLPVEARLLFAGLWTIADRQGRLEDRPKRIKIELFPADDFDIELMIWSLTEKGFLHRYEAGGRKLIHISSFLKHQSPHHREAESLLPACGCESMQEPESLGEPEASPEKASTSPSVAVYGSGNSNGDGDPVAVSEEEADNGFRDRYGTMTTAYGGRLDQRLCDEFEQLAEESTIEDINEAIRLCRSENVRPYPSEIRKRLPKRASLDDFEARKRKFQTPLVQQLAGRREQ